MTRSRLAAWNLGTLVLFTATTAALGLMTARPLVRWLGEERYGAARMVVEAQGYLSLLELGIGGALGPLLAREADDDGRARALAAGLRSYLLAGAAMLALGLAATPWVGRLVPVGPGLAADLRLAWLAGLAAVPLVALSPLRSLAEAGQRGYRVNLALTAQMASAAACALALASLGAGIAGQLVAATVGAAVASSLLAADACRRYPGLLRRAIAGGADRRSTTDLRRHGGASLLAALCGRVGLLTDALIVGNLLGPASATTLLLTQRLPTLGLAPLQGVGNASWAALAQMHHAGDRDGFADRLVELTGLVAALGVAGLVPAFAFNRAFFGLWMPGQTYGGDLVALVAAVNTLLWAVVSLWGWCFAGLGRVGRTLPAQAASAAVNLAASLWLTRRLGLVGPLLGTTLALAGVQLGSLAALLRRDLGVPAGRLLGAVAGPLAIGLPAGASLWALGRWRPPAGWISLSASYGASSSLLLLASWCLLDSGSRARWRHRLAAIRPGAA